jgi:NAD(P) transhydrogenase
MRANHYDLIAIGSGPAGEKGAARVAYWGKKVALIERANVLGGTVAGSGVPAKTLRETALHLSGLRQRDLYGVDLSYQANLDIATFMYRERHVRTQVQNAVEQNLLRHQIERFTGCASFVDPHTIRVESPTGETILTTDVVLIATGSRAQRIPLFPYHNPHVFDAESILSMNKLPEHLAVVGGGVVGCEFACLFSALGISVTLIHAQEQLFPFADQEISTRLRAALETTGINLFAPARVVRIDESPTGGELTIHLQAGEAVVADAVLAAVGRVSNVEDLHLEKAGVEASERGLIKVNQFYQTNVPHIYAAGDVIGFPALSSTSMEQARLAMAHAFDLNYDLTRAQYIPYGIWTIPEISMVGATEQVLQAQEIPYVVGKAHYNSNPRGLVLGEEYGLLKLLFSAHDRTLLGVHIIGQEACELIALGLMALETKATLNNFINLCFNFPSLSDMYKYAAYDALSQFDALEVMRMERGVSMHTADRLGHRRWVAKQPGL